MSSCYTNSVSSQQIAPAEGGFIAFQHKSSASDTNAYRNNEISSHFCSAAGDAAALCAYWHHREHAKSEFPQLQYHTNRRFAKNKDRPGGLLWKYTVSSWRTVSHFERPTCTRVTRLEYNRHQIRLPRHQRFRVLLHKWRNLNVRTFYGPRVS